jgi:cytochrome P450
MTQITLNDLFSNKHNPYPFYARLRAQEPLARFNWMGGEMWLATTYEDVATILKDPRFILDKRNIPSAEGQPQPAEALATSSVPLAWRRDLLNSDAPDHTRLRTLVSKAFTPRMIELLRPRIQQIADDLLAEMQPQGPMDLVADFAFPLPIMVISEMLGIPTTQRQQFRNWTQTIIQSLFQGPDYEAAGRAAEEAFISYIKGLLIEKRADPGSDLTSSLVQVEENGDALSEDELISMIFLLITAGHETTANLIANGTLALLEYPEQLRLLLADLTMLPGAIEELLRYTAPVSLTVPRWASEDVPLHGHVIRKGEMVRGALIAANTDPQQFTDPALLDILRQEQQHLAFGKGIHYCLGAPLARLEGQIAIGTLLRRFPHLRLAIDPEHLAWREAGSLRTLLALPVTIQADIF